MKKLKKKIVISLILCIVAIIYNFFGSIDNFPKWEIGSLHMYSLDVGQADCTLFIFPDGESMLIDAGNMDDASFIKRFIKNKGIEKIDYVIATHPHEDHIGGMVNVLESFEIGKFYLPDVVHNTVYYEDMLDVIEYKNIETVIAEKGLNVKDGDYNVEILSPGDKKYDDINHYSIVLKITYKDTSFILTGDAEKVNEKEMLESYGTQLESDVIKIGHHGSETSSDYEFLKAVNPSYGVISVGKDNDYGHPHKETKANLKKLGISYYRTDFVGSVLFISDGENIEVFTEKEADYR